MSDQQGVPFAAPAAVPLRPAGPAKKSLVAKLASGVADHSHLSLAIIAVLVIVVIGLYVYYHGLFILGPYAASAVTTGARVRAAKKKRKESDADDDDSGAAQKGDPETEQLINSINSH